VRIRLFLTILCGAAVIVSTQGAMNAHSARHTPSSVDWPAYNNDPASNRYASSTQISKSTVTGLHVICSAQLGQVVRLETGPIVVSGVLYATTQTQTYAINAATCATLWINTYTPTKPGGAANRGAAYANGQLFRGFADGHVIAIDAATGATVWNQTIIASGSGEYIAAAPVTWNSSIFIGTANGDNGQMCHVVALDQASGTIQWMQQTVPNLGQPAAKTWKGATRIAGGATWTSYTIDASSGKLYVPVGNPGPDFDIRLRKGSNLYTNSILELDSSTGTLLRGIQLVPEDYHDWDQAAAPAIVALGKSKKIILSVGKDGILRSVNLATLADLWKTPVTTISNAKAPITVGGTHFCPGGAVFWNGPSYSPSSGLVYVNSVDWCKTVDLSMTPQPYVPGQAWLGTSDGYGQHDPTKSGWVTAVDVKTGAVKWRYHATTPLLAGVTSTAGGLVFSADLTGNVFAFDDSTGAVLKTIDTGAAIGGGLISYEVSGTQYIAAAVGFAASMWGTPQVNSSIVVMGL
jgi:alcohol dehydrogenase (cytochrome c)